MAAIRAYLVAFAAASAACASAYADRIAVEEKPAPVQVVEEPAPYTLEILDKNGDLMPTYAHGGRYYVQGSVGARYVIRVTNPTDQRVEAVVSVDGLDVIDGETADFAGKRGYVVPAHGELRIEGFRVSTSQVAAFRFSSVADSYADRKGKGRNVGVIGLAVFEEKEPPQIIVQERPHHHPHRDEKRKRYRYDFDDADIEGELAPPAEPDAGGDAVGGSAAPPARHGGKAKRSATRESATADAPAGRRCCTERRKSRPGLGTEFGERRHSAVSWTRFERRDPNTPDAIAELRYNDTDGLRALGIEIGNPVDHGELETRETASPFPGSGFASPPAR